MLNTYFLFKNFTCFFIDTTPTTIYTLSLHDALPIWEIGCFGDLVAISFQANKNLTTAEGGCLVVNTEDEARLLEKLRLQGVTRFADGGMDVDVLGGKSNLTDIAAVIGLTQLPRLEGFNAKRRALAKHYFEHWDRNLGCELPPEDFEQSNWHMFQPLLPLDLLKITRGELIE